MADAGTGLLVTSMFGPSLNGNTGDWSVGCSGFWFENGEITYPVTEITVAGNLIDIYARLVPGSDLEIRGSSNARPCWSTPWRSPANDRPGPDPRRGPRGRRAAPRLAPAG
jgi:hypothetical protein